MMRVWMVLALLAVSSQARANGLYVSERGTRALGRAGAFVAGATGLDAVGHNPAGLIGNGVLGELTLPLVHGTYARRLSVDDGTGTTRYLDEPTIEGDSERIPFPTLVGAYTPESERYTLAFGLITPTFSLMSFPSEVQGRPSPARYTLSGFTDSRIILVGGWARLRLHERVNVGLGVHALVGTFRSTVGFSLSPPDRVLAAPEDPDYDAVGRVSVGPMIAPSASAGIIVTPTRFLSLGLSGELPMWVQSDATFDVRLPSSAAFSNVQVVGKDASLRMRLPAILRAGVQLSPVKQLALELAYVREFWSLHDNIDVRPEVRIAGVPGGPESFALPRIRIPRGYRDTHAVRVGAELQHELLGFTIAMRCGVAYEQSAVPPSHVSLSSLDFDKWLLTVGGGVAFTRHVRGDVAYVYLSSQALSVKPEQARIPRIAPIAGNAPEEYVNGGRYTQTAHVLSGSLSYVF